MLVRSYKILSVLKYTIIIVIIIIIIIIIIIMMMIIVIIIIIIIIIMNIIAFKGAIQDFLQSPHCAANCLQHVRSSGPGHVQHIERLSGASATWYEGTAQLLSLTELKPHLFELYFIG